MASYYKRKNGSYCIRVSNGRKGGKQELVGTTYYPPDGLSAKATEKAVIEYAAMFESAVREGVFVSGKPVKPSSGMLGITLSEFVNEHYYKRIEMRLSPNTVQLYKSVIEQCILPSFGAVRVCDISSAHLQALIDYLSASGIRADENNKEPLAGATIKRYATVFSSVMTEAYKMGLAEKDILHRQYISYPKVYKKSIQAYDDDEAKTFFEGLLDEPTKIGVSSVMRYLELQAEKSALNAEVKRVDNEMKRMQGQVVDEMGRCCTAKYRNGDTEYTITYNPTQKSGISKEDLFRLQMQHPDIYQQFVTVSESRRFYVKKAKAA